MRVFGVCNVSNDVNDMCIFIFNIYKLEANGISSRYHIIAFRSPGY
jgi:hypothetical protein